MVYVSRLEQELPPLIFPEDLEIGQYILVFQVLASGEVLNRTEKPVFYLADAQFVMGDIQTYRPSVSDGSNILPPGIVIMLETLVKADERLNPYLIWYNGKNRIGEGLVSEGAGRLLWTTPEQSGFQVLKAEMFPFEPLDVGRSYTSIKKVLSLPVAAKVKKKEPVNAERKPDEPVRWYQLWGNLQDSQFAGDAKKALLPDTKAVQWLPQGELYGLGIGASHGYTIPGPLFTRPADDKSAGIGTGNWQLRFRFTPLAEGIVFSGSLALNIPPKSSLRRTADPASLTVDLDLSWSENTLILTYALGKVGLTERLVLENYADDTIVTAVIAFNLDKNNLFRAGLGVSPANIAFGKAGIPLPGTLSGDGKFRLGAGIPRQVPREMLRAPGEKEPVLPVKLPAKRGVDTKNGTTEEAVKQEKILENTGTAIDEDAAPERIPAVADQPEFTAILNELTVIFIANNADKVADAANGEIDIPQTELSWTGDLVPAVLPAATASGSASSAIGSSTDLGSGVPAASANQNSSALSVPSSSGSTDLRSTDLRSDTSAGSALSTPSSSSAGSALSTSSGTSAGSALSTPSSSSAGSALSTSSGTSAGSALSTSSGTSAGSARSTPSWSAEAP
ncbi:hypothetical protein AGMMS50267_09500 [Spirochaetia bacterium]|nr:hypothetical protein AGMMS50267_09500 [Spirochaetia bacterium]